MAATPRELTTKVWPASGLFFQALKLLMRSYADHGTARLGSVALESKLVFTKCNDRLNAKRAPPQCLQSAASLSADAWPLFVARPPPRRRPVTTPCRRPLVLCRRKAGPAARALRPLLRPSQLPPPPRPGPDRARQRRPPPELPRRRRRRMVRSCSRRHR